MSFLKRRWSRVGCLNPLFPTHHMCPFTIKRPYSRWTIFFCWIVLFFHHPINEPHPMCHNTTFPIPRPIRSSSCSTHILYHLITTSSISHWVPRLPICCPLIPHLFLGLSSDPVEGERVGRGRHVCGWLGCALRFARGTHDNGHFTDLCNCYPGVTKENHSSR